MYLNMKKNQNSMGALPGFAQKQLDKIKAYEESHDIPVYEADPDVGPIQNIIQNALQATKSGSFELANEFFPDLNLTMDEKYILGSFIGSPETFLKNAESKYQGTTSSIKREEYLNKLQDLFSLIDEPFLKERLSQVPAEQLAWFANNVNFQYTDWFNQVSINNDFKNWVQHITSNNVSDALDLMQADQRLEWQTKQINYINQFADSEDIKKLPTDLRQKLMRLVYSEIAIPVENEDGIQTTSTMTVIYDDGTQSIQNVDSSQIFEETEQREQQEQEEIIEQQRQQVTQSSKLPGEFGNLKMPKLSSLIPLAIGGTVIYFILKKTKPVRK